MECSEFNPSAQTRTEFLKLPGLHGNRFGAGMLGNGEPGFDSEGSGHRYGFARYWYIPPLAVAFINGGSRGVPALTQDASSGCAVTSNPTRSVKPQQRNESLRLLFV